MLKRVSTILFALITAGFVGSASAATVTFDDISGGGCLLTLSPVVSGGFQFAVSGGPGGAPIVCDSTTQSRLASNGTNYLSAADKFSLGLSQIYTMTQVGGAPFSLSNVDLAELFEVGDSSFPANALQVHITGNLSGGGSVNFLAILDMVNDGTSPLADFQTFVLPAGFSGLLSSVVFTGQLSPGFRTTFNIFALDNLVTDAAPVPEPATLLLLGTGLAAAGMRRRMKKRG